MLRVHFGGIDLEQPFFRRRQQSRQPAFLSHLGLKDLETLLRERMPIHQNAEMIRQAFRQLPLQQRAMQQIQTALLQRPQRCHQVPAVNGRNKSRVKRLQRPRVIPVEQVSVRSWELGHGRQGPQSLLGKFRNGQKAELAGHLAGVKKKPQVSG